MKTNTYTQLVSCKSNKTASDLNVKSAEVKKEINARHTNWREDNKSTRRDLKRVYSDWYQVYRCRPAADRMVQQSQVDKLDKLEAYLQPIVVSGEFCQITTSDKRADEALASKVSAKTGKTHYIVPVRWTVSSLEAAIKYCAQVYAGVEVNLDAKFNNIK